MLKKEMGVINEIYNVNYNDGGVAIYWELFKLCLDSVIFLNGLS